MAQVTGIIRIHSRSVVFYSFRYFLSFFFLPFFSSGFGFYYSFSSCLVLVGTKIINRKKLNLNSSMYVYVCISITY